MVIRRTAANATPELSKPFANNRLPSLIALNYLCLCAPAVATMDFLGPVREYIRGGATPSLLHVERLRSGIRNARGNSAPDTPLRRFRAGPPRSSPEPESPWRLSAALHRCLVGGVGSTTERLFFRAASSPAPAFPAMSCEGGQAHAVPASNDSRKGD